MEKRLDERFERLQKWVERLEDHHDTFASKDWMKKVQDDVTALANKFDVANEKMTEKFENIARRVYLIVGGIALAGFLLEGLIALYTGHAKIPTP